MNDSTYLYVDYILSNFYSIIKSLGYNLATLITFFIKKYYDKTKKLHIKQLKWNISL